MYLRLGSFPPEIVTSIVGWVAEADIDSLGYFRCVCHRFSDLVTAWITTPWASDILIPGTVVEARLAGYLAHRPWGESLLTHMMLKSD